MSLHSRNLQPRPDRIHRNQLVVAPDQDVALRVRVLHIVEIQAQDLDVARDVSFFKVVDHVAQLWLNCTVYRVTCLLLLADLPD